MSVAEQIITPSVIEQAYTYEEYRNLIEELLDQGRTTGDDHSEAYLNYTKLNNQRMKRLDKTVSIRPELQETIEELDRPLIWLVLTEAWCGDAAQNIPVLNKMAEISDSIELKLILRDEHLEIMDQHLTNGSRSIPKLVCLDKESLDTIGEWGPRPEPAQQIVEKYKDDPEVPYDEMSEMVQRWYLKDRAETVQDEFEEKLEMWQ